MTNLSDDTLPTLRDYAVNLSTPKVLAAFADSNFTESMDGRYETAPLNLSNPDTPPDSAPVPATDDGPTSQYAEAAKRAETSTPANDNAKPYHLKKMYELGELGNGPTENRLHWVSAERLRLDLMIASGEPINDSMKHQWRELMLPFYENFNGDRIDAIASEDMGMQYSDDGEFVDTDTTSECNVVEGGEWNPYRDLPPGAESLYAAQKVFLAHDAMGKDFELVRAFIESNWTTQIVGEMEGYTNRASASACGKGMLRTALRNLTRFYDRMDRLEESGRDIKRNVHELLDRWRQAGWRNQARGVVFRLPVSKVAA